MIRPRGMPPTPRARSSAIEPVGIDVDRLPLGRAELHDRRRARTASRSRGSPRRRPCRARPAPAVRRCRCARRVPLSGHRHRSVTLLVDAVDRSPERTRCASVRSDQPSSVVVLDDAAFLARLADQLDVLRRLRERLQLRLGRACPSASSWLPCWGDLESPSLRLRVGMDRLPTDPSRRLHGDFTAAHPAARERAVRAASRGRFRPGSRRGSWP